MKYDETKWKSKWRERISTWKQIRSCFTHRLIPPRLSYRSRMCSRSKTRCVFVLYLRGANMYHHSVVWVTSYSHCWAWSIIIPIIDSYEFLVITPCKYLASIHHHPPIIHPLSTYLLVHITVCPTLANEIPKSSPGGFSHLKAPNIPGPTSIIHSANNPWFLGSSQLTRFSHSYLPPQFA
jgi:hypothetical protein